MNFTNCTWVNETAEEYLQHLQDKTNLTLIPAVVMLSIFAVTGLIGNVLVLVVYSKKFRLNPTKVLIMTIASFDLIANVGAIPSEILVILNSWSFSNAAVCRSKAFLVTFTTIGSAIPLVAVAIVRYRTICRPHSWQMTTKQAQIASVATVIIASLVCTPYTIVVGIRTKKTQCANVQGHECFYDDRYFHTIWPLVSGILFILIYVSFSSTLVVLYTLIGMTAWRHSRKHRIFKKSLNTKSNAEFNNSILTAGIESKRFQHQQRLLCFNKQKSVTGVQKATIEFVCNRRFNPVLYCVNREKRLENQYESQAPITMNAFALIKANETTKHSYGINAETTSPPILSPEVMVQEVVHSTGRHPKQSIRATCEASSPESTEGTLDHKEFQLTDQINEFTTEALDKTDTTREVTRIQESNSDAKYTKNTNCKQTISISENDHGPENEDNFVAHNNLNTLQITQNREFKSNSLGNNRKTARRKYVGRVTVMLIIISATYVFGFIPFLVLKILKNRKPDLYASLDMAQLSVYNLFYRFYFVNSAANPLIYSLCNIKFRRACVELFSLTSRRRL